MPCRGHMHFVVDEEHRHKLDAWVDTTAPNLHIHYLKLPEKIAHFPGYIGQQWVNFWADEFIRKTGSQAQYAMFTDTDSVFGAPVTCNSLFDEDGKMYMAGWTMSTSQRMYKNSTLALTGVNEISYMSFFPFMYPMESFPRMRAFVAKNVLNISSEDAFDDALLAYSTDPSIEHYEKQFVYGFSQFVIMGNYLVEHEPEQVHQIFCPVYGKHEGTECQNWAPQGAHVGWRACNDLLSCVPGDKFGPAKYQNRLEPIFSKKFSSQALNLMSDMIEQGMCYRDYLVAKSKYGDKAELPPGCALNQSTTLHMDLIPYPADPPTPEREKRWAELFTPDTSPELCKSYAVMQKGRKNGVNRGKV